MTLISSISGIRGTIGGTIGNNLTPIDIINYTSAYSTILKETVSRPVVVVGRDGRVTGAMVQSLIINTLMAMGVDVIDCGLTTTPSIEMGIIRAKAEGGVMISASHNPMQWNALKLFNANGEFIDAETGNRIKGIINDSCFQYSDYQFIGSCETVDDLLCYHIDKILSLPYIDCEKIKNADFKVAVDGINSTGGIAVPLLLKKLGVKEENIYRENCDINGEFAHDPEPLAKNLTQLSKIVTDNGCNLGIAVDPDVDRLAFMSENGEYFGEEYTLVACADFVLQQKSGNTVSNLSSSRALNDLTEQYACSYYSAAVGEVNVVDKMKAVGAVIGGEGNGGVILPELHYGRDALLGIALILSYLAKTEKKMTQLRASYPNYFMAKDKIVLKSKVDFNIIKNIVKNAVTNGKFNESDGLKIDFSDSWVHLRTSNTEPVIRVYAEAKSMEEADFIAKTVMQLIINNI